MWPNYKSDFKMFNKIKSDFKIMHFNRKNVNINHPKPQKYEQIQKSYFIIFLPLK